MNRLSLLTGITVAGAWLSLQTHAQRSSGLWLNEVPLVTDTTTHMIYTAIEPHQAYALTGTMRWSDQIAQVSLNGTSLTSGKLNNFSITDWSTATTNTLTVDGTEWQMVFTTLPIVLLEANQTALYEVYKKDNDKKSRAYIQVIDPQARTKDLKQQLIEFGSPCMMRVRGATAAGKEKKPFAISLIDENGEEKSAHLLGYRDDDDWILDAQFNDWSKMRNRLITDLWTAVDPLPYVTDNEHQKNGTEGEHVEVFMKGRYWGLYCLTDKVDRKKLNLKKLKEATSTDAEVKRGLLWKSFFNCSATTLHGYDTYPVNDTLIWEKYWEQKYPDDRQDQAYFNPIANAIDKLKAASGTQASETVAEAFYLDNAIDYMLFMQAFQLMDNQQKNMYLSVRDVSKDDPVKLLITLWDLDASIGRDAGGDPLIADPNWMAFGSKLGDNRIVSYLKHTKYQTPEIRNRIYHRWQYLKTHELSLDNIHKRMEHYAYVMTHSGAWKREYDFSSALREKVGKSVKQARKAEDEVEYMMNFLKRNYALMDAEMDSWGAEAYDAQAYEDSLQAKHLYIVEQDATSTHEDNTTIVPGNVTCESVEGIKTISYADNSMRIVHTNASVADGVYSADKIKEVKTKTSGIYPTYAFMPSALRDSMDFDTHYTSVETGVADNDKLTATDNRLDTGDFQIQRTITVRWEGDVATVTGNVTDVTVTVDGADVIIETALQGVNVQVLGATSTGRLLLKNTHPVLLTGRAHVVYDAPCDEALNDYRTLINATGELLVAADLNLFSSAYNGRAIQAEQLTLQDGKLNVIMTGSGTVTDAEFVKRPELGTRALYGKTVTINGGIIRIKTMGDQGGVGIAGADRIDVNGGTIYAACYDDPMKAASQIAITGGKVVTSSTTNDGMDSKGGFAITGGVVMSYGPEGAEGCFDCDGKNFSVSGGTVIGVGCKGDAITSNSSTQAALRIYKDKSLKRYIRVVDAYGNRVGDDIETPVFERDATKTLVFSSPLLVKGNTYQVLTSEDGENYQEIMSITL